MVETLTRQGAPAGRSVPGATQEATPAPAPAQALIPEARQRQRSRYRRRVVAAVLAVAALVALLVVELSGAGSPGRSALSATSSGGAPGAGGTSAVVLVRPVLCFGLPAGGAIGSGSTVPTRCPAPYAVTAGSVQPLPPESGAHGVFRVHVVPDDPALAGVATSTHDVASRAVLLPFADAARGRLLLGPAELTLSKSSVRGVHVVPGPHETWTVDLALSSSASAQLDRIASRSFHTYVAIDVGGRVVGATVIEPSRTSFTSLEGHLDLVGRVIGGLGGASARELAAAVGR